MELDVTWAFAFGNHDDEADLTRDQITALDQTYDLSLTELGPNGILVYLPSA